MRDSLVFQKTWMGLIELLPKSKRLNMYEAIIKYACDDEEPKNLTRQEQNVFNDIKPKIDANNARWKNSKKGGAPIGNTNAQKQPKNNLETTKKQLSVSVSDSASVSDSDKCIKYEPKKVKFGDYKQNKYDYKELEKDILANN